EVDAAHVVVAATDRDRSRVRRGLSEPRRHDDRNRIYPRAAEPGQLGETVTAQAVCYGRGEYVARRILQLNRDARQALDSRSAVPAPRGGGHGTVDGRRELEDVVLQVRDSRIRLDDLAQRVPLPQDGQLVRVPRLVEVEEAVPGAQPVELVGDDPREQG